VISTHLQSSFVSFCDLVVFTRLCLFSFSVYVWYVFDFPSLLIQIERLVSNKFRSN